ncbi:MAG: LysR family transcriptional regulator [SAR86 cluster bacterium]|uniref:LysR family transcriptional regulator n=1 Tax=SAR86 cluster bacterium TaxID=2030880 RepID=A0A2A5CCE9_9GAMM|nr:MAG: LysR family transcriptional regulator [SAR86 cluster bacterium]
MSGENITLKQLRYYSVAARYDSLRQAARELRISQPSLSAQLSALEETLGVELFERSRNGVFLTPLGRDLLQETHTAIQAVNAIAESASFAAKGPTGMFRLGVTPSIGPYSLPWILPAIHKKYKKMKFFVREEVYTNLAQGLMDGKYDLILTTLPLDNPAITVMPLLREPIYLVTSNVHRFAKKKSVKGIDLDGEEILTIEEHHQFYKQVEDLCIRFHAKLLRDYEGTSLDAIRQMVYMEMGIAFMPALYLRSEIKARDNLHILSLEDEAIFRIHALAWRNTSPLRNFYRKLGESFQTLIKQHFKEDVTLL